MSFQEKELLEERWPIEEEVSIENRIRNANLKWTQEDDALLLKTIIHYIRNGSTIREALNSLDGKLTHHKANCEFRYRHVLQFLYVHEIATAKKEAAALKRLLSQIKAKEEARAEQKALKLSINKK